MDKLTPTARDAVELVKQALEPHGWSVDTRVTRTGASLRLDHPLSTAHDLNFANDGRDHRNFVHEFLGQREFRVIAQAPGNVEHGGLLRLLREAADANGWDTSVLVVISHVLERAGALTPTESEWLEGAGAAWSTD